MIYTPVHTCELAALTSLVTQEPEVVEIEKIVEVEKIVTKEVGEWSNASCPCCL